MSLSLPWASKVGLTFIKPFFSGKWTSVQFTLINIVYGCLSPLLIVFKNYHQPFSTIVSNHHWQPSTTTNHYQPSKPSLATIITSTNQWIHLITNHVISIATHPYISIIVIISPLLSGRAARSKHPVHRRFGQRHVQGWAAAKLSARWLDYG